MELKEYYWGLTPKGQKKYAKRIGTTTEYIRVHLIPQYRKPDRGVRTKMLTMMASCTDGNVSLDEVIEHFLRV